LLVFHCGGSNISAEDAKGVYQEPERREAEEPEIADASDEPAGSMDAMRLPEGWTASVFAAEPDVANIVAFHVANDGRVFVCETFRQNRGVTDNRGHDDKWLLADLASKTVQDRIDYHRRLLGDGATAYETQDDRVRLLVDSNGDGRVDESSVYASGFNAIEEGTGAGVLARGKDVYYTCIPRLWNLHDADADGGADQRRILSDGHGVRVAFRGHDSHGLIVGPDMRLYFSIGDRGYHITTPDGRVLQDPASGAVFRCELDGSNFEVFARGLRNPQELAFNSVGDLFSGENNSDSGDKARIVHIVQDSDAGWRMFYQYLPDRGPFNREKIWHPMHEEQPAYIVPPIVNLSDGPSGLAYYPGTGFGDAFDDTFFLCDFRGGPANSGIRTFQLSPKGAFYDLKSDAQPIWSVLATDMQFGPDGAIWVSDWVDGWNGLGKGRMYRLIDPKEHGKPIVEEVRSLLAGDFMDQNTARLQQLLEHRDMRIRLEAQWALAKRGEFARLLDTAADAEKPHVVRLHGVWGAEIVARYSKDPLTKSKIAARLRLLVDDPNEFVRAAAIDRLSEMKDVSAVQQIAKALDDDSARVRYFAARAVEKLKIQGVLPSIVRLLAENNNADPVLRHGAVMALSGAADEDMIAALREHESIAVRRAAVVALRRMESDLVAEFLDDDNLLVVAEAARAIHDPYRDLANAETTADCPDQRLAALVPRLLKEGIVDTAIIHRVLAANFRTGDATAAQRLATYAASESGTLAMRAEAVAMLADWEKPDPRDRVLNDHRPYKTQPAKKTAMSMIGDGGQLTKTNDASVNTQRDREDVAGAIRNNLEALLASPEVVSGAVVTLAADLRLTEIADRLVQRIDDSQQPASKRANAIVALSKIDAEAAGKRSQSLLTNDEAVLRVAALQVMADVKQGKSVDALIAATSDSATPVRQKAWDLIARFDSQAAADAVQSASQALTENRLPADVQLNVEEAAKALNLKDAGEKIASYWKKQSESDPLAPWLRSLSGGDLESGRRIFFGKTELSCVRCHRIDRQGGEVGPVLTVIGKQRDRRYLLEAICLPNAAIAKGFETAVVLDDVGQQYSGIVRSETDDYLELLLSDGRAVKIEQDAIELRKKGMSSMPADLTKLMTARELRDLVAYLESLKVDPRAEDDIE
ncbi:MAG: HEAT repeat domain-containing protein, partial [Planctomycetota bacterium]